jgi:hypothetical protein
VKLVLAAELILAPLRRAGSARAGGSAGALIAHGGRPPGAGRGWKGAERVEYPHSGLPMGRARERLMTERGPILRLGGE